MQKTNCSLPRSYTNQHTVVLFLIVCNSCGHLIKSEAHKMKPRVTDRGSSVSWDQSYFQGFFERNSNLDLSAKFSLPAPQSLLSVSVDNRGQRLCLGVFSRRWVGRGQVCVCNWGRASTFKTAIYLFMFVYYNLVLIRKIICSL